MLVGPQIKSLFYSNKKPRLGRLIGLSIALFLLVGVSTALWARRPEITPAIRGKKVAERMGCFACHGPEGFGGVPDPVSPGGRAPGWDNGMAVLYINHEKEIEEWILDGEPKSNNAHSERFGEETLVPMPAYRDLVSTGELADLKAYFIAVAEYYPEMPDEAYEGSVIAKRLGCFGCHGPSGMGGMENPRSFTGIIPSWDGEHFEELVKSDHELREWIIDGEVRRLMEHPIGRFFINRQIIQMPAYKEHLSEEELQKVMIYIKWLRGYEAKDREADNPIA
ncbi:hypothetical protein VDG1235_4908 [Verrucomicrobiia bacterium DG1235]|nr:hypothetical protein VDG1235_4908 [Verrucomicrobiae bacterium DG1235]